MLFSYLLCTNAIAYSSVFCTDAIAYSNAQYGQGIIPILLDDVSCSGTEARLIDCTYDSSTSDCSHSDDASVKCQPSKLAILHKNDFVI